MFSTVPVVLDGKLAPEIVIESPVDAEVSATVTVPAGTVRVVIAVWFWLALVCVIADAAGFRANALSVAVMVRVPAAWVTGIVMVPTPEPSDEIGKIVVPARVVPELVISNVALRSATSPLSTVKPATVTVTEEPGPADVGSTVTARVVYANPLDVAVLVPSVAETVSPPPAVASDPRSGILVA
jgi:hypothetical protein